MIDVMDTMKIENSRLKSPYQFQKGVIVSCKSLMGLYDMLQQELSEDNKARREVTISK